MADTFDPDMTSQRVAAIDVVRGLTILLMIFVNDIAGVPGTPSWLKHFTPSDGNGMTLVDVVFPAFLFIVGLSIPLAFRSRRLKGESSGSTVLHVLTRTLSLVIIGVFMVNSDAISQQGIINSNLWTLVMYVGVFLVWMNRTPATENALKYRRAVRLAGILLLVVCSVLYRTDDVAGWIQLRPRWWGILGLIGWAYLVAAIVYLLGKGKGSVILGAAAGLSAFYIAIESGWWSQLDRLGPFQNLSCTFGSHSALVLLGVFMGRIFLPESSVRNYGARTVWGIGYAIALGVVGWLFYLPHESLPFLIVNKNMGTPPWCLFSAAITAATLVAVYWLVDRTPRAGRPSVPELAGRNALFAYILAPFLYALSAFVAGLTGTPDVHSVLAAPFAIGLARSVGLSILVMGIAALLSRQRIALKI